MKKKKQAQHSIAKRIKISKRQTPKAIVLTCSDSRLSPEIIFDQDYGDLFVVRVAGNILDESTTASIEYAVDHLGVNLIVIMGHESCGAVKAAVESTCEDKGHSHDLKFLVAKIQNGIGKCKGNTESNSKSNKKFHEDFLKYMPLIHVPVIRNVNFVSKELIERSKVVKTALEKPSPQKLVIVSAIYDLDDGRVEFWKNENNTRKKSIKTF